MVGGKFKKKHRTQLDPCGETDTVGEFDCFR
jgi:hypothetical protein